MKYFIGVDGGGSRTQAVVVSATMEVVGRGEAGASNHYVVGAEQAVLNCQRAADLALEDARRIEPTASINSIAAWGFGLAGVRRAADAQAVGELLAALCRDTPWTLATDAVAAHSGAFAGGSGIILSVGTGVICCGVDDCGEQYYSDGWGPLLGDEGGGYWIGQEALRAVCRAHDGRGGRTRLSSMLLTTLTLRDIDALVQFVHSDECSRELIADLARAVLEAAAGDEVAFAIRDRAITHVGVAAAAVARAILTRARERAGSAAAEPVEIPVALRGGILEDDYFRAAVGYALGERMVEMKRDYLPLGAWRIIRPQYDAAVGAALLAVQAAGD